MQTRRASKVAAAAVASSASSRAFVAVTPSPKKHKTCHPSRQIEFCSDNNIRNELKSLVLSHIDSIDENSDDVNNIDTDTLGGWW